MCDQQRLRSACAYAQSDQSLSKSLEYSMTAKLLTVKNLEFLSLTFVRVYTCQNATLLEITCHGSKVFVKHCAHCHMLVHKGHLILMNWAITLWLIDVKLCHLHQNILYIKYSEYTKIQHNSHFFGNVFVWFYSLCPSQQFFSYVGMGLPGLNQY